MSEKNLVEFLEALIKVHDANIEFIACIPYTEFVFPEKYRNEIEAIQDLINSFDFIKKEAE